MFLNFGLLPTAVKHCAGFYLLLAFRVAVAIIDRIETCGLLFPRPTFCVQTFGVMIVLARSGGPATASFLRLVQAGLDLAKYALLPVPTQATFFGDGCPEKIQ